MSSGVLVNASSWRGARTALQRTAVAAAFVPMAALLQGVCSRHGEVFVPTGGGRLPGLVAERFRPARIAMTSTAARQFLHLGRYPKMWKDSWIGPIDMARADMSIAGFDAYAIVGVVLLQVILGLYGDLMLPEKDDPNVRYPKLQRLNFYLQSSLLMFAIICSTFAMFTFLLVKANAVTALGLYEDVGFRQLLAFTLRARFISFASIIVSILLLMVTFSLNIYTKVKGNRGLTLAGLSLGFSAFVARDILQVATLAARPLIFGA